ncbi:3-deoxy-D-manno-octulosonic acid transferase [Sulfitobacter sp. SK012]|uniref:3-deoxy-D-manno-octulosonic acid transferase n=1 Tax=Sulfitobacter sp. SK012 TaxID=1389005 RepID=UPI000E0CB61F|nr:glycosyltransferase N-terminal domain-containing protein [Sulfitobacter sp. SK012]AXI44883.1 3-deoxy-D-manno-octulosonic acid transferase [Sulfitobacter sp. SK012]
MAGSLGLTAYRALMRRGEVRPRAEGPVRPLGELLWVHAAEPGSLLAIQDLAARLRMTRPGINVLVTLPEQTQPERSRSDAFFDGQLCETVPEEHPDSVAAFLDHWQPDTCIWVWGGLRPNLVLATAGRNCPMFLIDADTGGFDGRRDRWLPDVLRNMLPAFDAVLARSSSSARRLIELGLTRDQVEVTSPLLAGGQALNCPDQDVADFSAAVVGRTVWFANAVQPNELQTVFHAHRQALRLSHRLLLVLRPADGQNAADVMAEAKANEFRVLSWGDGPYPDESTQVLIADDPADVGLFYRVAPVSFLGSSLIPGTEVCDPFEAAALGSAVLYGPRVGRYLPLYSRLAQAGAARIVNDADALGTAVSRLTAPDQAAAMAHAGWDVISQGAELTDHVIDLVQDALDERAASK